MRKQKQKYLHDPENGQTGDCYRTALAILLDMNRDDVPHWVTPDNWESWAVDVQPKYDAWLAERGLKELPVALNGEHGLEAILSCSQAWWGSTPAMLTGESRSGCNHVVIIQDGEIVCDPSTTDAGIIGPCNDGFFWITALIPVNPSTWLAAKEKYEPRWIPVSERLPEPFTHVGLLDMRGFQNCPEQMQGADHIKDIGYYSLSPSLDQGTWSIRGERSVLVDAYTHWMKLPPAPSTTGGGE